MPLSGHTRELSLPDLLQLQGMSRSSCHIELRGPAGPGRLVLSGGEVVDAEYGGLRREDAAYALMAEEDLHYEVRRDVTVDPERRTMAVGAQELIMEAARRSDEGELVALRPPRLSAPATLRPVVQDATATRGGPVTTPSAVPPSELPEDDRRAAGAAGAAGPASSITRTRRPGRSGPSPRTWAVFAAAIVLVLAVVATGGWYLSRDGGLPGSADAEEPSGTAPLAAAEREPVDAAELTGPRDELPERLTDDDPPSPDPDAPLQPTVVLRLHIDSGGRVTGAQVYSARPGLEAFEQRALDAVEEWRFAPARREGVAVPSVINWPVEFDAG